MKLILTYLMLVASTSFATNIADFYSDISLPWMQLNLLDILKHNAYSDLKCEIFLEPSELNDPHSDLTKYNDEGVAVHALIKHIKHRNVTRPQYFSLFNDEHRHEALMLFEVFLSCKNWFCVVKTGTEFGACMNEGAFVYGLYVAIKHMPLTRDLVLPPLYEITPHMFTNSEIIDQAYSAAMTQTSGKFRMGFTGSKHNKEQRVAYFMEDIGLNLHHVNWHMDFPFWWKDSYGHHFDRKGELFFWVHHQLTARFDAERLSNHLDIVDELYWDKPIVEGFAPHTSYRYGGKFPARPDNVHFEDVDGVARIRDMIIMEQRIRDAIAHGYIESSDGKKIDIRNEEGIDVLGDIIESSTYSPNVAYYGALHNLAHIILGRQGDPHGKFNQPPGVMEHFETATRDPSFFRLHKYMDNIFKEHKDSLPQYTKTDLKFEGVSINTVNIKGNLETYFEDFEFNLIKAVPRYRGKAYFKIGAIVSRLNHEVFDFEIDVTNSNREDVFATVRIYLCPLHDDNGIRFSLNEQRWHCIEMDKFWRTLHAGANHIVRSSEDASSTIPDQPTFDDFYIETAYAAGMGKKELDFKKYHRGCGIPNRLLIPKGKEEGMEFSLVVILTDDDDADHSLEKEKHDGSHCQCGIQGEKYPDQRPMGFPFDRHIPNEDVLTHIRNFHFSNVIVKHNTHH